MDFTGSDFTHFKVNRFEMLAELKSSTVGKFVEWMDFIGGSRSYTVLGVRATGKSYWELGESYWERRDEVPEPP